MNSERKARVDYLAKRYGVGAPAADAMDSLSHRNACEVLAVALTVCGEEATAAPFWRALKRLERDLPE